MTVVADVVAGIFGVTIWTIICLVCLGECVQSLKRGKIDLGGKSEITRTMTPWCFWSVFMIRLVTLLICLAALVTVMIAATKGNIEWDTPESRPPIDFHGSRSPHADVGGNGASNHGFPGGKDGDS